jgi:hypothetical protein
MLDATKIVRQIVCFSRTDETNLFQHGLDKLSHGLGNWPGGLSMASWIRL